MRTLLCALAGIALLCAPGADVGKWGPDGWGLRRDAHSEVGKSESNGGGRDMETEPDRERWRKRKMVRDKREKDRKRQRNRGRRLSRLERGQREEYREKGRD